KNASHKTNDKKSLSIWSIGGSIFAMFFGAGNIVFPLALGYHYNAHPWSAYFGMMLTAVCCSSFRSSQYAILFWRLPEVLFLDRKNSRDDFYYGYYTFDRPLRWNPSSHCGISCHIDFTIRA
ncbi:Branched-chain amino acid transport system carrier protein, partial [Chlamydia pneumoniae B21]